MYPLSANRRMKPLTGLWDNFPPKFTRRFREIGYFILVIITFLVIAWFNYCFYNCRRFAWFVPWNCVKKLDKSREVTYHRGKSHKLKRDSGPFGIGRSSSLFDLMTDMYELLLRVTKELSTLWRRKSKLVDWNR